jgi:integrase
MASLRRHPRTKYWIACYLGRDGRRYQRSTKVPADGSVENRRAAQKLADAFEDAARKLGTAQQMQRVISDLFRDITGSDIPHSTVEEYFRHWLSRRHHEVNPSTHAFYSTNVEGFLTFLGEKSRKPLTDIDTATIRAFRSHQAVRLAPATVNHSLKVLRMIFKAAKREGLIADAPTEDVPVLKKTGHAARRAFKLDELKQLVEHADPEWRSLIFFGLYTGQRLGDLSRLQWQNIDLEQDEIRLVTSKTGRQLILPIATPLLTHIATLAKQRPPAGYVHARAARVVIAQKKVGTLSRQFYDLMADVGLVPKKRHRKTDPQDLENRRRERTELSFHALRHTATSLMKNAGISPAIVEEFIGHDSKEINRLYTHIETESLRKAAETIPDLGAPRTLPSKNPTEKVSNEDGTAP